MKTHIQQAVFLLILCLVSSVSYAQPAANPFHIESVQLEIGPYYAEEMPITEQAADQGNIKRPGYYQSYSFEVSEPGAAWLKLRFTDVDLGSNSYIQITSDEDGGQQRLDAQSMLTWNYGSAIFNGSSVTLTIYVSSTDTKAGLTVSEVVAGEYVSGSQANQPESQCGPSDNRTPSSTGAIGRISPVGCTGWLIANGGYLTAGHCTGSNMDILEFNVPASDADGTTNASNPDDQYPITSTPASQNADANNDGGNDWAVFTVGVNSNTNLTPNEAQGSFNTFDQTFFRVTKDNLPSTARVTGFGTDDEPPGPTSPFRNSASQTQQTHTGTFVSETVVASTDVSIRYTVDTEGGNSGSPVIMNGTINTVGIHTNAGCNTGSTPGSNEGTGFEENDLETAIENMNGTSGDLYVDEGHPSSSTQAGTVFRPFKTVNGAITAAASGNTIFIAEGGYPETVITNKNLLLKAPVGLVIIGPGAPLAPSNIEKNSIEFAGAGSPENDWEVYPNPVVSKVHIKNKAFRDTEVKVSLYNPFGQLIEVLSEHHGLGGTTYYENFDLSDLPNGIYVMLIDSDNGRSVKKLTKTR